MKFLSGPRDTQTKRLLHIFLSIRYSQTVKCIHLRLSPRMPLIYNQLRNVLSSACLFIYAIQIRRTRTAQWVQWPGYGIDGPGFELRKGKKFSLLQNVPTVCGAHKDTCSMGTRGFLVEGLSGRSVSLTNLPPSDAEVKNKSSFTLTPYIPSWRV